MNDIVPIGDGPRTIESLSQARLERFWAGKSDETRKAYGSDLMHFARWGDFGDGSGAMRALLRAGRGGAHELVHAYLGALLERKKSPALINRRLTAIRASVDLCRQFGFCDWELEIKNVTSASYKDTRGPGLDGVDSLLVAARAQERPDKVARDVAIIRLLFDIALRRNEVASLDLEHIDIEGRRVSVMGKGRLEREFISIADQTAAALVAWIGRRGDAPGPLFHSLDNARRGDGRLNGDGIFRIIRTLGNAAGITARPHGLRHSAITHALDITKGDVRAVQRFSRHRNINTLKHYDDNRADLGGAVARSVAASLKDAE